jgi:small subunit ribosomal protein S6
MENTYELVVILSPSLDEAGEKKTIDKISSLIKLGGNVISQKKLGKKTLAYSIKKVSEGIYYILDVKLISTDVKSLDSKLTLEETVLRHLIVAKDVPTK